MSSKPQLILTDETLYIGFKVKKTFKWVNIKGIKMTRQEVDYRDVSFLKLTIMVSSRGQRFPKTFEFPINLLDIKADDVYFLIKNEIDNHRG
ncbi:MAG: hypothetical protein GY827_07985 [Cytophagales bacterium]|nr:hypothetical protein [Cytophagales bacterium]